MINRSEFEILKSVIDKNDKDKGIIKVKGTSKKEIQDKVNLSISTINNALTKFKKDKLIDNGIREGMLKTYTITKKGLNLLKEMKGIDVNE